MHCLINNLIAKNTLNSSIKLFFFKVTPRTLSQDLLRDVSAKIKNFSELGSQSQRDQIVVINLAIVIHIQVIVTFFSFFIVKSFSKKSYFLIDYVNN